MPPIQFVKGVSEMSQTQKDFIKFWIKLLLFVTLVIVLFVGSCMGSNLCILIGGGICLYFILYVFAVWVGECVYMWRIMGVLTPTQYKVAKWYRYSLCNGGPDYVLECLQDSCNPNDEYHIAIMKKIKEEVKIPKILLTNK